MFAELGAQGLVTRGGAAYLSQVKLRDVVDLEAQLALDDEQDEPSLRNRDRALYLTMSPPPASTEALLRAWLDALRAGSSEPSLGERVATAQRLLGYGLVVGGLASGWGVAEVLLHFEQGGAPVNVGYYLLVLVFAQLAMLALLALGLLLRQVWPRMPIVGDFARLLRFVADRLQRRLHSDHPAAAERLEAQQATYRRIQTRLGLYQRLERYLLLSQTQLLGVAFNLGALASCLRLILLSDLAFSWSTSVASLDAEQVQRLCATLAWPFAWLLPDAAPSPELIANTQYFRLEGRFAGAEPGTRGNALLAGAWWQFLVACTVTYGLVPRVLAYVLFWTSFRRAERSVPLDTPAVQRVLMRLTSPAVSTRARALDPAGAEPAHSVPSAAMGAASATSLLLYRDIPTDHALLRRSITDALGVQVVSVHQAGGLDVQGDAALCKALGARSESVTLVAEAWEAPDKGLRSLLAALRLASGPRRTLRVALIGEASAHGFKAPAADDVRVYRDRLTLLDDPYLIVESLPAASAVEHEVRP
jgi:hypothetical protein